MRRFSRSPNRQRRKIEWSGAYIRGAKTFVSAGVDSAAEWVRVPSGAYDPVLDNYEEENETLIRMRVDATMLITPSLDPTPVAFPSLALGIIAWPSIYDDATVPVETPSPTNPTYPWIWRWTLNPAVVSPSAVLNDILSWEDGTHNGPESVIDVRSQRKLPPGVGLLLVAVWESNGAFQGSGTVTGYFAADVRYAVKQA